MNPTNKLLLEIKNNKGVRIGQTAVVSRKIHTISPNTPESVNIIVNADAGQVFYQRAKQNEILHIDLFHEITKFNLRQLADYIKNVFLENSLDYLLDNMDLQTGSGGGRLTGDLCYGTSGTLKKSHLNHVHVAILLPDAKLNNIFFIINVIEKALQEQGVELRKIERIKHEVGNSPMDMSQYATDSDSNLKQSINHNDIERNEIFQETLEIIERFGSLREVEMYLEDVGNAKGSAEMPKNLKNSYDCNDIFKYLKQREFVGKSKNKYSLTNKGRELAEFMKKNRRELESILKQTIKNSPKLNGHKGLEINFLYSNKGKGKRSQGLHKPYDLEEWGEELDVPETVRKAMIRSYLEGEPLNVKQQDMTAIKRMPVYGQDICLLIDASASMAGYRLTNAKYLARHLILIPHTRISILAFQDKEVTAFVSFTKNYETMELGIKKIVATGLTPLALALEKCTEYMSKQNLKNPLIMLITDGIPTVPLMTADPISDAVTSAGEIAKHKIAFCCIGLQPNKDCLIKVTSAAKGKLYILDELDKAKLIEVVRESGQLL